MLHPSESLRRRAGAISPFARIAREAGTSRRPLQDRYAGRSQRAASTWTESAEPVLRGLLLELLASAGLLETAPDDERFADVLDALVHPVEEVRAAVEFLIVAQFDEELGGAVDQTLGRQITRWCTPTSGALTREDAARRAFLLSAALGLVLVACRPGVDAIDAPVPFDTGDPVRDRLLQATLDEVGTRGYDAATVDAIAQAAQSSQGALFARYPTKVALFLDASRRQAAFALRANEEWMSRIEEDWGHGVAEAAFIRESQRPGRHHLRVITLEQMRTGWHEPAVREALAREYAAFIAESHATKPGFNVSESHAGLAIGGGTLLLCILYPDAWLLPYDVVTVAWEG